ncbi:MAG: helix-turn-helix domain-containing protein [Microcoleaceae cyanobacterium]
MSVSPHNFHKQSCPAQETLQLITGRWKVLILRELFTGLKRFNQLQRALTGITQKVLTQQLRELVADQIIHREVYAEVPPRVEYSLTPLGESLKPIILQMHQWGIQNQPFDSKENDS